MKKHLLIISRFAFFAFLFIFLLSPECYCEEAFEEIISSAGELSEFAVSSSEGSFDFHYIKEYFKGIFIDEFSDMKKVFISLFWIIIISSVKECFSLSEEISSAVSMLISAACIFLSSKLMTSLFENSKDCIFQLGDFMFLSFPYLCSLLASAGKTLSASKGALITLGGANLLCYLMENFFLVMIYLYYILAIASSVIENDIFKSLKKSVISITKISLPFIVGIYSTVLGIFLKTSAYNDDFLLKTTKNLMAAGVPFLGNILSESADNVLASVQLLKSQVGIAATIAIIFLLAVPVVKLLCGIMVFKALEIICSFFGNEKITVLFRELSDTAALLAAITVTVAVAGVISIALFV